MKRNINKIVAATLIAGSFVACSDEIENSSYGTPYTANTGSITSAGTAVDLGLPSGTKWADKNVGAANAQDMGLSFIWGDVTGTQLSATAETYSVGKSIELKPYFEQFKGGKDSTISTILLAKAEGIKVQTVDSIRDNYACDLVIERHASIKVKDADGNFILDEKGDFERKDSIFVEVEGLILMSHTPEGYAPALAEYLKPYKEDQYNKYVIAKSDSVFYTDVIQKIVPAEIFDIAAFVAEAEKSANKVNVSWSYFTDAKFNEDDMFLYADFVVEASDTVYFFKGNDAEVPALSIVGNADYDAATKNWGAGWAMPTTAQLEELLDEKLCTWEFVGNGYTVTGPNGSSIFLPAAGYRYEDKLIGASAAGYYASGEVNGKYTFPGAAEQLAGGYGSMSNLSMANIMIFNNGQFDNSKKIMNTFAEKNIGISIRPVSK